MNKEGIERRVTVPKELFTELDTEYFQLIRNQKVILVWEGNEIEILPDQEDISELDFIGRRKFIVENLANNKEDFKSGRVSIPINVTENPECLVAYIRYGKIKIRRGL